MLHFKLEIQKLKKEIKLINLRLDTIDDFIMDSYLESREHAENLDDTCQDLKILNDSLTKSNETLNKIVLTKNNINDVI